MLCRRLSPLSQKVTLREIRQGTGASLEDCLRTEFRMVCHCCTGRTDFREGVIALLIEKRGQAHWDPPSIEQVPSPCAWPLVCSCLQTRRVSGPFSSKSKWPFDQEAWSALTREACRNAGHARDGRCFLPACAARASAAGRWQGHGAVVAVTGSLRAGLHACAP